MKKVQFDAVIVANGQFPAHQVPLGVLDQASHIIACDGAISHVPHAEAVVGDGDSVPAEYHDRLIRIDEQEDNDLTKATRFCLSKDMRRIVYLGTTGLREDHTLGNISLMARYVQDFGIEPLLATDHGWFVVARGETVFDSFPGQQVSIFNLGCSTLDSEGLRWQAYPYRQLWQGTLNEAVNDTFTLRGDGKYMVFRTYKTP